MKGDPAVVFTCFCRFSKGAFCTKSLISTGRTGRLKPGKLRIKQDNFQYHYREQNVFKCLAFLLTHLVVVILLSLCLPGEPEKVPTFENS